MLGKFSSEHVNGTEMWLRCVVAWTSTVRAARRFKELLTCPALLWESRAVQMTWVILAGMMCGRQWQLRRETRERTRGSTDCRGGRLTVLDRPRCSGLEEFGSHRRSGSLLSPVPNAAPSSSSDAIFGVVAMALSEGSRSPASGSSRFPGIQHGRRSFCLSGVGAPGCGRCAASPAHIPTPNLPTPVL